MGVTVRLVFDRPLWRDPILRCWGVLNLVLAAFSLNRHTTWSGSLDWHRVGGFLDEVATNLMLSYLLLALLPALVRWWWRGRGMPRHSEPTARRSGLGVGYGVPLAWSGPASWEGPVAPEQVGTGPGGSGTTSWSESTEWAARRSGARPAALRPTFDWVHLPAPPHVVGRPTRVWWSVRHADSVSVNGRPGYPPTGSAEVLLDDSGSCVLVAHAVGVTTTARTAPAPVVLPPSLNVTLPPGPEMAFDTSVHLGERREGLSQAVARLTAPRLLLSVDEGMADLPSSLRGRPRPRNVLASGPSQPADTDHPEVR